MTTEQPLSKRVGVRLTEIEHARLKNDAAMLGTTPSMLARSLLTLPMAIKGEAIGTLGNPERERPILVYDKTTYPQLIKQIRAWGYHYDQALHALNTIAAKKFMSQEDTIAYIEKATRLLEEIEDARGELLAQAESMPCASQVKLGRGR